MAPTLKHIQTNLFDIQHYIYYAQESIKVMIRRSQKAYSDSDDITLIIWRYPRHFTYSLSAGRLHFPDDL